MASLDAENSPPNLSFTIRPSESNTLTRKAASATARFFRSISTKEPSFSELPDRCSPTHHYLSSTSLHNSPTSSPFHHLTSTINDHASGSASSPTSSSLSYKCISSVLKKDGQILSTAVSNNLVYTGSDTNLIRIWKLPEFSECGRLKTKACRVVALEVSHDKVYAAYGDGKIRVWRRTWGARVLIHVRLATIPSGNYIRTYLAGKDKNMAKHMGPITSLAINVLDGMLYSASLDKTVKVWRISDLKCIETIQAHFDPINAIIAADDGILYTGSDDATIKVWRWNLSCGDRPRTHSHIVTLPAKDSPVKSLILTASGALLYGGCNDGYIHYWLKGWLSSQVQYGGALQGHTHAVMCLANVANYLVSGSADATCRIWARDNQVDGQMHTCLAVLVGHRGPIRCVAAFLGRQEVVVENGGRAGDQQDGCTVCSGSLDGVIKVWQIMDRDNINNANRNQYLSMRNGHNDYFGLRNGS